MRTIRDDDLPGSFEEVRRLLLEMGRSRSLRDPIALAVEELKFSPSQVHSVLWLGADGELTMSELASRLGITEKTITGVVDRLEREGYAQRIRSESDRRVVRVKLTKSGQTVHKRFDGCLKEQLMQLLMCLDGADRKALVRILQKLVARVFKKPRALHDVPSE